MLTVIGARNQRYSYTQSVGLRLYKKIILKLIEQMLNNKVINTDLLVSYVIKPDSDELLPAYRGLMYNRDKYTGVIVDWIK